MNRIAHFLRQRIRTDAPATIIVALFLAAGIGIVATMWFNVWAGVIAWLAVNGIIAWLALGHPD